MIALSRQGRLNRHFDIGALDLNGIRRELDGTEAYFLTRANVVLPHVPGADDDFALQDAFAERSALVETSVVCGVNVSPTL